MKKILLILGLVTTYFNNVCTFFPLKFAEILRARNTHRNVPSAPIFNSDQQFNVYMYNLEHEADIINERLNKNKQRLQFNKYLRNAALFIVNLFKGRM